MLRIRTRSFICIALGLCASAFAQEGPSEEDLKHVADKANQEMKSYSPSAGENFPREVLWGDTHLHTSFSPDAGLLGNARLGPEDAYKVARGDEITAHNGMRVRLTRPLDFLVVTDHAEYLGLLPMLRKGDPTILQTESGKRWYQMLKGTPDDALRAFYEVLDEIGTGKPTIKSETMQRSAWEHIIGAADTYNDPGKFTAFIGYEWTSMPGGNNLHRVVIFRDGSDKANQTLPFSAFDSENPEDLWAFMQRYEEKTGGKILAIAHNGNVSNGLMFNDKDFSGKALTKAYAETRMLREPLYEVTQIKGDGEAHPLLSPDDEFADYETWDQGNLNALQLKEEGMLKHEYARSALKLGLQMEKQLGANPFKFGMLGSTDAHTSLPAVEENNYWGKMSIYEPSGHRAEHKGMEKGVEGKLFTINGYDMGAAGYAAVWATENTRQAIFEAMQRKEVYATTGSRMLVRVFGGWDFEEDDILASDFVGKGYTYGVPMGGDLEKAPDGKAPTLMIRALRDPDGANLDRIQVIKGWLDREGNVHERIYNAAWSGDRELDKKGKLPPVGSTVDVANAKYANTIGSVFLTAAWRDPDFDAKQRAFYYVRVLEIPTPRWTAYDAKYFGVEMPEDAPMVLQERAYTSPIWYTP